jgi:hypothetical protein
MLKLCSLLIIMTFLLSNCAHHRKPSVANTKEPAPVVRTQQTRVMMESFTQVDVQGRINVNLHTGYKTPQLTLKGDPRELVQVQTMVRNGTLYVNLGAGYPQYGDVSIDIHGGTLNRFSYKGAGMVTGAQLYSRFLDLYLANQGTTRLGGSLGIQELTVDGNGSVLISGIKSYNMHVHLIGNPKVELNGTANLAELNIDGGGWLSLYWVQSKNLLIRAKKQAKIQLAGVVNHLDVELWGTAQFKGRYLRAKRSFVKTHQKSVAEISSVNHQSSLATDVSDIYYYNIPHTRQDFMGFKGSVLDMRDLKSPYINQKYDRYNKHFP